MNSLPKPPSPFNTAPDIDVRGKFGGPLPAGASDVPPPCEPVATIDPLPVPAGTPTAEQIIAADSLIDADDAAYLAAREALQACTMRVALLDADPATPWETLHAARKAEHAASHDVQALITESRQNPDLIAAHALRRQIGSPPAASVPKPPERPAAPSIERGPVGASFLADLFRGFVYVQDIERMATPDGVMLSESQFNDDERFAGRLFPLVAVPTNGSETTERAWEAAIHGRAFVIPQVRGIRFDPRQPEGAIIIDNGQKFVNTWRDPNVRTVPGDASLFVEHVRKLLPNGDDALILLCYLATCVQHRGVKAAWAPFLQGMEGNGKSLIGERIMRYALGSRYVHKARSKTLDSQFNASFFGSLMVLVDDVKVKGDVWEALKPMVTDTSMQIEGKGVNSVTREVCFNFIFTANPRDGLKKSATDRRICPLFCAQQEPGDMERDGLTEPYFKRLHDWLDGDGLAIVAHFLQTFPIDPRYNFAAGCIRAPHTTSTDAALFAGQGAVRQRMQEIIDDDNVPGLRAPWVNWSVFKHELDKDVEGRRMPPGERRDMLSQMGYVRHPGLQPGTRSVGQVDNKLPDGSKPYLWIKRDHPDAALTGCRIAEYYLAAQAGTAPPPPRP